MKKTFDKDKIYYVRLTSNTVYRAKYTGDSNATDEYTAHGFTYLPYFEAVDIPSLSGAQNYYDVFDYDEIDWTRAILVTTIKDAYNAIMSYDAEMS